MRGGGGGAQIVLSELSNEVLQCAPRMLILGQNPNCPIWEIWSDLGRDRAVGPRRALRGLWKLFKSVSH